MSSVIKKGDLGAVDEVLGWDPRGDAEEYNMLEKAQEAFSRIKKELSSQKKCLKEEKQRYDELYRMQETYIKKLHAAEKENKHLLKENEELNNQVEAYKEVLETRREHAFKADERYFDLCEENKRLREALERISIGMDVRPFDATAAQVEGYFRGFAEAALKKGG
jgi:DNA repair exonuclease SbcCD ATPase subunit